jgi:glycosyltransferase involved in cell wall biosynthesis
LPRGINRVQLAYIRHYQNTAHAILEIPIRQHIFHWVFPQSLSQELFDLCMQPATFSKRKLHKLLAYGVMRSGGLNVKNIVFNLAHNGFMTPNYGDFFNKKNSKVIFMVHDLIPINHAEYCGAMASRRHFIRISNVLQQAHGIIANSEATLIELKDFAQKYSLPSPPMIAAPLASGLDYAHNIPSRSRPLADPYFVLLGALEARKNHVLLLEVWKYLWKELGNKTPKLVIIGQCGYGYENASAFLERCQSLQGCIVQHTSCTDEQLFNYIEHAQALLFPSIVEGYGLPIVEALSLKTPVIASDLPVYKEFAGNIPEYLSPIDGKAWLHTLRDYATDCESRNRQLQRLQHFKAPSWGEHFTKVQKFITEI